MKNLHTCGNGTEVFFRAVSLIAAAGCIVVISVFVTCYTSRIAAAHAVQKEPCRKSCDTPCDSTDLSLPNDRAEAETAFQRACGKCHVPPDPAKPFCASGLSDKNLAAIWNYLHEVKTTGGDVLDCLVGDGEEAYRKHCANCHKLPDTSSPNCLSETPLPDLIKAHKFMEDAREGKDLYGKSCNSCHPSIVPSRHNDDFLRRHLCAEASGLETADTQKVLLYLKVAGGKK